MKGRSYGRDPFARQEPPQIVFHIEVATGALAESLRIGQAQVTLEVLTWAAALEETSLAADPRQAG